jgi:purine-cytosine permease-like protein
MNSVELGPVADADQTQSPLDLFFIFAGANIAATTLQIGATLPGSFSFPVAMAVIVAGSIGGALLVAALAPLGPRLRVPSIVATRAVLGFQGAQLVALLLFVTNFAWIALNNVIAASICARLVGGIGAAGGMNQEVWAVALGVIATITVIGGPKAVGYADRFAVPLLFVTGIAMTIACLRAPWPVVAATATTMTDGLRGIDAVAGYQVSWLLMFGDYSRYSKSPKKAAAAVFIGLAATALWFMPLGLMASTIVRSSDPGAMVFDLGLGWLGAALLVLATLTTNFVNIYMSALALKSLRPKTGNTSAIWLIGGIGAALSVLPWLDQVVTLTSFIAGTFFPIGGILLAHFFLLRIPTATADLYPRSGFTPRAWSAAGLAAWAVGTAAFFLAAPIGGALPSLLASIVTYVGMTYVGMSKVR